MVTPPGVSTRGLLHSPTVLLFSNIFPALINFTSLMVLGPLSFSNWKEKKQSISLVNGLLRQQDQEIHEKKGLPRQAKYRCGAVIHYVRCRNVIHFRAHKSQRRECSKTECYLFRTYSPLFCKSHHFPIPSVLITRFINPMLL